MDDRELLKTGAAGRAVTQGAQSVVGSWFTTITATNPPLGGFTGLISFHEGGVVTEARRYFVAPPPPFPPLLETSGHGAWKRTGPDAYEVFFRFLLQQPPPGEGNPIGTDNIRLRLTYVPETDTLKGTFVSQVKDVTGNVLMQVEGTYTGERITV